MSVNRYKPNFGFLWVFSSDPSECSFDFHALFGHLPCLEILLCQKEFLLCTRGGNVLFANLLVSNDCDLFGRLVCRAEMEGKVLEEATLAPHLLNDSRVVLGVSIPLSP